MINALIAYDDQDFDLGDYFQSSHGDIVNSINANQLVSITSIQGLNCTELNINTTIQGLNGARFIFVAIAHGNEEVVAANEVFISNNNSADFTNSLFYSCACSNGHTLGRILVNAGCLTFVGYKDDVWVVEDYHEIFYGCQNSGIKSFLIHPETIQVSFDKMIAHYTQEIDRLVAGSIDDVVAASSLIGNRDCLVLLGNNNLTHADFSF